MNIENLATRYNEVRRHSLQLAEPLSEEDCCAQSMPDASPVKWHLAHTTWFFETFVLEKFDPHFKAFHPAYRMLFNSYYNGVGEKHIRSQRGLLTRPSLQEIREYRSHVDQKIENLIQSSPHLEMAKLIELGLQHEQQHQELILTDVKHLLSMNPLMPAYSNEHMERYPAAPPMKWNTFQAGLVEIGHAGAGFCFDNELPRHRQFVEQFQISSRLVTNNEYLAFIESGGYKEPSHWLSEGWDWVSKNQISHPHYWRHTNDEGWKEFTLKGLSDFDFNKPVTHISYFEADAFARWMGARLPTETEWEHAASEVNLVEESIHGLTQLFGVSWQWTSTSYAPYPGFQISEGAIGEYNGKFMVNQYVLRGSSCGTPMGHSRLTYRNFFPATACWQFTGIRLAKSMPVPA